MREHEKETPSARSKETVESTSEEPTAEEGWEMIDPSKSGSREDTLEETENADDQGLGSSSEIALSFGASQLYSSRKTVVIAETAAAGEASSKSGPNGQTIPDLQYYAMKLHLSLEQLNKWIVGEPDPEFDKLVEERLEEDKGHKEYLLSMREQLTGKSDLHVQDVLDLISRDLEKVAQESRIPPEVLQYYLDQQKE